MSTLDIAIVWCHLDMATFLDARKLLDQTHISELKEIVKLDALDITPIPPINLVQEDAIRSNMSVIFEEDENTEIERNLDDEINEFVLELKKSVSINPLQWWKQKEQQYRTLSQIAKKYLCMTATSVPSERVFSVSGNMLTKQRFTLTDEHVEQLTFLSKNKNLL